MKKLVILAAMLAMVLATTVPAFAQNAAETNADQFLTGPTDVSSSSSADQGDFAQGFDQAQTIDNAGGGDVVGLQTGAQTGVQAQVPVSIAANVQQVPVSLAADLNLVLQALLGL